MTILLKDLKLSADATGPAFSMTGNTSAEQKLAAIEAEIARLRHLLELRLSAVADELRRAEARDEWAAAQLREMRRDIRRQGEALETVRAAICGENR